MLGTEAFVQGPFRDFCRHTGPSLSPFNAWVLLKGLETLRLRVEAAQASAVELSNRLEADHRVAGVRHPWLASHPHHDLARAQMSGGGTILTVDLRTKERAFEVMDRLAVFDISNNVGDTKSLVTHPATTTHRRLGVDHHG